MAYAMIVAAVVTAVLVTGLCFALKWRKVVIVAPLQFVASLLVTYFVGPQIVREPYRDDALLWSLGISAAMPALFVVLRVVVGRLDKRHAGGLVKQRRNVEHDA